MTLSNRILPLALATVLIAGCNGVNMKQFEQPRQTATIIRTTSFHPDESDPTQCGTPYDENDLYPNKTEYLDSYGNPLLEEWFHPEGETFMYARYYYHNTSAGQLDKVVQYEPPKKPKVARFVRDKNGAVTEITETIILPDKYYVKTETTRDTPAKETSVYEDRTTVLDKTPMDGNRLQVDYTTNRTDSITEVGTKVYDQNTGKLKQHSGAVLDKGEVKLEFGKKYEYTPDGKISRIISHEGMATGYYTWEYDDHGNWTLYRYWKEPTDGKEYSQEKEYTYNERGDWTRCVTTTNGEVEAIVIKEFEYIGQ